METRYFKTLIKVCETGSFSKAAELLYITQSAVSQRIKFLEEAYDHQLLDRSGSTLVTTEVGRFVLEKAKEILIKEQELLDGLKVFKAEKRLSICCTPTFGMAYLPRTINDFVLQNADVNDLKFIFKQPAEAARGVLEKEYDLAIIEYCDDGMLNSFSTYPLPDDELVFISSPALNLPKTLLNMADLLGYTLYSRRDGCSSKNLLRQNLINLGCEINDFRALVVSDDLNLCIQSVMDGGGISFVSRSLVDGYLQEGRLCAHYVEGFRHVRSRAAFHMESRKGDALIQNFIGCLFAAFAQKGGRRATDRVPSA